jgi:hypothetical protein
MKTESEILAEIECLRAEREEIHAVVSPLNDRLSGIASALTELEEARDKLRFSKYGPKDVDLDFIFKENGEDSSFTYDLKRKMLSNLGLHHLGGVWSETNQVEIGVALTRQNLETVLAGVRKVLPYMKPWPETQFRPHFPGLKVFSIWEETLSQRVIWYFAVGEGGEKCVVTNHYQFNDLWFDFLREGLKYIQRHHPAP